MTCIICVQIDTFDHKVDLPNPTYVLSLSYTHQIEQYVHILANEHTYQNISIVISVAPRHIYIYIYMRPIGIMQYFEPSR